VCEYAATKNRSAKKKFFIGGGLKPPQRCAEKGRCAVVNTQAHLILLAQQPQRGDIIVEKNLCLRPKTPVG
jgi:hypothetical protein